MHDLFDIVGLSRSAAPVEVRRVCARAVRRLHPDFGPAFGRRHIGRDDGPALTAAEARREVAVDFVDMATVLDRIQRSFFSDGGTPAF